MTTQELPALPPQKARRHLVECAVFDPSPAPCDCGSPPKVYDALEMESYARRARLAARVEPIARVPVVQRIEPEALIRACVPGGYSCDPQAVADAIRAYFAAPQAVQQSDADPLTKLTRLSEEMGLYDEPAHVPVYPEWLLYGHDDGRHAVAPSAEEAIFAHGDPTWHRVGPVAVYGVLASPTEGERA